MPRRQDLTLSNLTIKPINNTEIGLTVSGITSFNSNVSLSSNVVVSNNLTVGGNTSITGNLTVHGTTTTIESVTTVYQDPILQIGGTTVPTSDDNKDRGVSFYYHDGAAAKLGFMGYDNSADMFTFLKEATISSEVASGTNAGINCGAITTSGTGTMSISGDAATTSVNVGTGAGIKTCTLGSTNTTSTTVLQSGTGPMTFTAGGNFDVNAAGAVTIDGSSIAIGATTDVAVDIDAAAFTLDASGTLGITSINTQLTIASGTGTMSISGDATDTTVNVGTGTGIKKCTLGSTNTTSTTVLQSGTGPMTFTAGGIFDVNAAGAVNIDGSAIAIGATLIATTVKGTLNVDEAVSFDTTLLVSGISTLGATTGATVSAVGILNVNNETDATTTTNGSLQTDGGLSVVKKAVIGGSLYANAGLNWFGCKKFQSFIGTLANIGSGDPAFADGDVLVELGTLESFMPIGYVAATKFFIDKVVIGITTPAGQTLVANIQLSATSGTAANSPILAGTVIVGAAVNAFDTKTSATSGVTAININMNAGAGSFHVFEPNISAPIGSKYLYLVTKTALEADATAGRFTVIMEYSTY